MVSVLSDRPEEWGARRGELGGARYNMANTLTYPAMRAVICAFAGPLILLLSACASAPVQAPIGAAPGGVFPATDVRADYKIGPLDKISITVFQVPDLTLKGVQVDAAGQINLPLIGIVKAEGKSAQELSTHIADRLREGYLQSPQVTVLVEEAISQKITVEGSVVQPGVYAISGPTTLLQAVAMARGPDKVANLREVILFRTIDGKRAAAVFDLKAIRRGAAPDPEVYGNDVVVLQGSGVKGVWQEVVRSLPAIGVFSYF